MIKLQYDYYDGILADGESQYSAHAVDTRQEVFAVNAIYVQSASEAYRGNPFIEALPPIRNRKAMVEDYYEMLPGYDHDKQVQWDTAAKLGCISALRQVRFPLGFVKELEVAFVSSLLSAYSERRLMIGNLTANAVDVQIAGDSDRLPVKSVSTATGGVPAGFSLIGYSGVGKSCAVERMLSRYPQLIFHLIDGSQIPQITYLVVSCPPNSNLDLLFVQIGKAIDIVVGNLDGIYEKKFQKLKNHAQRVRYFMGLVEAFNIGMLILDEIQELDLYSIKSDSFDYFLNVVNTTKLAVAVIGTEEAREAMFPKLHTGRRIGPTINAYKYCMDKAVFETLVKALFKIQWFDDYVPVTQEIVDALYIDSQGIIDQLVGIYQMMQYDYIMSKKRPSVNAEYVHKVVDKHFAGLRGLLKDLNNLTAAKDRELLSEAAANRILESKKEMENKEFQKDVDTALSSQELDQKKYMETLVVDALTALTSYKDPQIKSAFNVVYESLGPNPKTKQAIKATKAYLSKHKEKSASTKKVPNVPDITDTFTVL